MSAQFNQITHHTAKPVVAGIFNLIIGSGCVICALAIGLGALIFIPASGDLFGHIPLAAGFIVVIIAIPFLALGVLSIVGGIYSLQRRMWGWALAGSIAAAFLSTVFGIASIILTAVSRDEFAQ